MVDLEDDGNVDDDVDCCCFVEVAGSCVNIGRVDDACRRGSACKLTKTAACRRSMVKTLVVTKFVLTSGQSTAVGVSIIFRTLVKKPNV